jgi:hypothetical protein
LKLEEAVLKERPAIESGLAILKIIAAVAPLLGLLGTVTGMIETFQAITIFGAGDPKNMAGGISAAPGYNGTRSGCCNSCGPDAPPWLTVAPSVSFMSWRADCRVSSPKTLNASRR